MGLGLVGEIIVHLRAPHRRAYRVRERTCSRRASVRQAGHPDAPNLTEPPGERGARSPGHRRRDPGGLHRLGRRAAGLRVALIDRDDFGGATSANSLRIVHGGLRYLARGDWPGCAESIRERSALLRVAPGLVEPLPVLVPTGRRGRARQGARSAPPSRSPTCSRPTRNRRLDLARRIAAGRIALAGRGLRCFPALDAGRLTGGALWYDARMTRPERLTLAFVARPQPPAAAVANYAEAETFDVWRTARCAPSRWWTASAGRRHDRCAPAGS